MQLLFKILICFLAGMGAGIGTGFAGMSAAAIVGPMLIVFLKIPAYQAIGIGLLSDVLASGVSAYTYKKNNNLDIKNSFALLISVLFMTMVGSFVAKFVPEQTMGNTTQIALIILGLRFIIKPVTKTKEQMASIPPKERLIKSIAGGTLIGFICGFIGAGGGMMMLFILTTLLGYQMHMAVGTSVFIMAFTALTGGISHIFIGGVPDISSLILCILFTLIWARIAAFLANKASAKTLNRVVGIVMIITSITILIFDKLL